MMKNKMLTIAAGLLATGFWFFDSIVHYFIYAEPSFEFIPSDFNELWMRVVIVLLIFLLGIFGDYFTYSILIRDKQLEVARTYNGMIQASLHILVNLLNQMHLFKLEAQKRKDFDREVIKLYDNAIDEASNLVDTLSRLHDVTERTIGPVLETRIFSLPSGKSTPAEPHDESAR